MTNSKSSDRPLTGRRQTERPTDVSAKRRVTVDEALAYLSGPESKRFATVFNHGTLQVDIYSPQKIDPQQPHSRDEVYIVVQGSGEYISAAGRQPFEQGDFLFAPAGEVHRFEELHGRRSLLGFVLRPRRRGGERRLEDLKVDEALSLGSIT